MVHEQVSIGGGHMGALGHAFDLEVVTRVEKVVMGGVVD